MADTEEDLSQTALHVRVEKLLERLGRYGELTERLEKLEALIDRFQGGEDLTGRIDIEDLIAYSHPEAAKILQSHIEEVARKVAISEREACYSAVALACAPVVGTPYITGPRKFCDAIRDMPPVYDTSLSVLKGDSK